MHPVNRCLKLKYWVSVVNNFLTNQASRHLYINCHKTYIYQLFKNLLYPNMGGASKLNPTCKVDMETVIHFASIRLVNDYPTVHYFGNPRHTQSMTAEISWRNNSGNSRENCIVGMFLTRPILVKTVKKYLFPHKIRIQCGYSIGLKACLQHSHTRHILTGIPKIHSQNITGCHSVWNFWIIALWNIYNMLYFL